jgi:hypothetical protein
MSVGETSGPIHPVRTVRSGYHYQFYDKHHGQDRHAAQWLPEITRQEEFAIFEAADSNDISDERGWLYGIRPRDDANNIQELGTWGQQLAEFPFARRNETWHGYPLWPLIEMGPENRRGEKLRPAKVVFFRLEGAGMLSPQERKRLNKGRHL